MLYTRGKHINANTVKLLQEARDLFFQKTLDDLCSTTHRRTMDRRFRVAALSVGQSDNQSINQSINQSKGTVHIGTISVEVRRTSAHHQRVQLLRQSKQEMIRKQNKDNMHAIVPDQW